MEKEELLEKFKGFCKRLSKEDRVALIHHSDADGLCSALVTAKAIEKLTGKRPVSVTPFEYGNRSQGREAVAAIKKNKANKLIVLDIGIDSAPHGLADKCSFEECLVIDHHKLYRDLNSKKVVFLKAEFFTKKDPSSYVTSKFAFDLFNKATDVKEFDWIACIGILGDMNLETWKGFVKKTIKKRKISMTLLYELLDLIAAVEAMARKEMRELFWAFYETKNPKALLESRFKKHFKEFKKEKDSLVLGFEQKAECFPSIELFLYPIKARHEGIKSHVINEISEMHPDKTIILLQCLGSGRVRFSARRLDFKVAVNDLIVEAIKGIPNSSGGGHRPAAAGSVPRKHLSKFKQNLVSILRKRPDSGL